MPDLILPDQVLNLGLILLSIDNDKKLTKERRLIKFKKHYGAHPLTLATQWYALCTTDIEEAKLTEKEKRRGLKMFLVSHYFLWNYPRNSDQLADRFRMCTDYARGKHLWDWIQKIAGLEKLVIDWPKALDRSDAEVNVVSIDGVDKKTWERPHKTECLPYDRKNYTQKHAHGGIKYQVTLCAHRQQCVHIFGPVRGGMGDKEMLERSGILNRLVPGKLANCDRGYIKEQFAHKIAWPNPQQDSKLVNNLKSRIRLRHETFNGKMAFYATMSQTWRHTDKQHGLAFRAIAVTIQYALNDGTAILFEP